MKKNFRGISAIRSIGFAILLPATAIIGGCVMPPATNAQSTPPRPFVTSGPVPALTPEIPPTPKAKSAAPMEFQPLVKIIMKGDGEEDAFIGREVAFKAKAPRKQTGFMDVDRKKGLFAECLTGTGKYNSGKLIGKYAGNEAYDDAPPALVVKFKDCRAI
ncbi:hypothetical protein [Variovorax sp. J31P207]|uniref:hypothetical protein n=1 Tax=Variovorax sp. J31P207 TaxID=3053510 RepID=UPI002576CB27|nr:hypothetical protein [Variovorax sp. J31P207]MDM0071469.1 hypothetical protein [Variovorax sp. J31P207]